MSEYPLPVVCDLRRAERPQSDTAIYAQRPEIASLMQLFKGVDANVWLRGSFLRREKPFDDIDLLAVTPNQNLEIELPAQFRGIKIAYSQLSNEELEHHFVNSPRSWYGLLEPCELKRADDKTRAIFIAQQDLWARDLVPDHMAFLISDDRNHRQRSDLQGKNDYERWKYADGSKHTIMRGMYLMRLMYPEGYISYDTLDSVEHYRDLGLVPDSLPVDVNEVYEALAAGNKFDSIWEQALGRTASWAAEVRLEAAERCAPHLPSEYVDGLNVVRAEDADSEALEVIFDQAAHETRPYRKWNLFCSLAAHPNTPRETLVKIWDITKGDQSNKSMLRFLLRHQDFPIEVVRVDDLPDSTSRKMLLQRQMAMALSQ